jgi:hypothetical protein
MPPSEPLRVFISYARKDGAVLAQRLQASLQENGFDAWLDTQRILGGATWTTDIEHALDEAELSARPFANLTGYFRAFSRNS